MKKEKLKSDIHVLMSDSNLDLYDLVEVLANVFIEQGCQYVNIEGSVQSKLELANKIVEDIRENGETLPNSLVRQGLIILSWLKSKEKNL